jgi:Heterokaryon incompatibility protein (HET)
MASLPRVAGEESTKACPEVQRPSHSHGAQISKTDIEQCPLLSKYTTLDRSMRAFRVLRLTEDGYELHHATLDDPPRYHAISHYWGPPDVLRPVMVDGEQVKIRQTTWFMLKSLYRNYDKVLVWLDMLCINQHDRSEREHQVGLMGEIYSNAASIHAWLGEHSIDSEIPFQFALELRYNLV